MSFNSEDFVTKFISWNSLLLCSDRVNQLIEQQRQEQNPEKRQAIFAELQQILAQDVPYVPLWQTKDYAFAQSNITGVTINPSQNFPFWTISREQ